MLLVLLVASGAISALAFYGFYALVADGQTVLATSAAIAVLMAIIYGWYLALTGE